MNVGKNNKIKREDDGEISIGTQDTYSQRSLTNQEDDEYKEDSFLLIDTGDSEVGDDENSFLDIKRDYLRRKKNVNKECCRRTLEYNEDYFLMRIREKELEREKIEKKKNNLCCRRTLEYNEDYFLMRIHEKELEREKLEKKKNNLKLKYEENVRNMKNAKILHEIRECKAAIRKAAIRKIIYKHKLKVYLKCNHEPRGGVRGQGDMETNAEE